MEVHFSPEQEARLSEIAAHAGTNPELLVKDAALRMVAETAAFRAAVRAGLAQADRGDLLEDSTARQWLQDRERVQERG